MNVTNVWVDRVDVDGAVRRLAELIADKRAVMDSSPAGVREDSGTETGTEMEPETGGAGLDCFASPPRGVAARNDETGAETGGERLDCFAPLPRRYTARNDETGRGGRFRPAHVCTPNAEFMMEAQRDGQFMRIINEADLVVADGAGVVLAARLLGFGKIDRTPGFDMTKKLVTNPDKFPISFYLLGGKPGIAEKAAENILELSPSTRVAGCRDGYFSDEDEPAVIEEINKSGADALFVALGSPKAEKWIYRNRDKLRVPLCMGVGGTLDIIAGAKKPAPPFFRKHGLEWLYRLFREPWRAGRMTNLPLYVLYAIWWKLAGRPAPRG